MRSLRSLRLVPSAVFRFTCFNCRFTVDVPGPDDLEAKGDFTDPEYEFWRQSGLRATVSKQWFAWSDTCAVEIVGGGRRHSDSGQHGRD